MAPSPEIMVLHAADYFNDRLAGPPNNAPPGAPGPPSTNGTLDYCGLRRAGLYSGPTPNLGPGTAAAIWALVGMSAVFLVLRIYCKIWRSRGLWWDDWVLIISWVLFLVSGVQFQRVINMGFGHYPCDILPQNVSPILLNGGGFGSFLTILACLWSKTSFGITILRLTNSKLKVFVWTVVLVLNVVMILQALFVWVKCNPVKKNWLPMTPGWCWSMQANNGYSVFANVFSGACDILFALLPWHLIWSLNINRKEKVGVIIAMSMGVFAGITTFIKSEQVLKLGSKNFTHDGTALLTWSAAEISTTIMASCIPVLRVLLRELREVTSPGNSKNNTCNSHSHGSKSGGSVEWLNPLQLTSASTSGKGKGKDQVEVGVVTAVEGGDLEAGELGGPGRVNDDGTTKKEDGNIGNTDNGAVIFRPTPPLQPARDSTPRNGSGNSNGNGRRTMTETWSSYWNFDNDTGTGPRKTTKSASQTGNPGDDSSDRELMDLSPLPSGSQRVGDGDERPSSDVEPPRTRAGSGSRSRSGSWSGNGRSSTQGRASGLRSSGFIIHTQEFEVKYEEGTAGEGEGGSGGLAYELGKVLSGGKVSTS